VLVGEADDALLGTAIVLPDHPRLAPESRGDLFDGTEIEEALLLHVMALSDAERDEIARQDPAVRAMVARAAAATPADLLALHGRTTLTDSEDAP
jgi:hydrogenase maturation protease